MIHSQYYLMLKSAQRRPEIWRIVVLAIVLIATMGALTPLLYLAISKLAPEVSPFQFSSDGFLAGTTPGGLFVILAGFSIPLIVSIALARKLHGRRLREITGDATTMRRQFWSVFKWISGLMLVTLLLPTGGEIELTRHMSFGIWLMWLPLALLGLAVQVTAEEVIFRGYLQSQITGFTGSYWTGILASSLIFGLNHYNGDLTGVAILTPIIWATAFGIVAGDLTARSGTLGPVIAIHLINNMMAMLIAPPADMLSGFGLWVHHGDLSTVYSDPFVMLFEGLGLVLIWLCARIALRR